MECFITGASCNFIGVITSKCTEFNNNPYWGLIGGYGIDDWPDVIYSGSGAVRDFTWEKSKLPTKEVFKIKVTADWTSKQCKLSFYHDGKKLNPDNEDYTILLPEFDEDVVLYPCVTPFNKGAYFKIDYV